MAVKGPVVETDEGKSEICEDDHHNDKSKCGVVTVHDTGTGIE
jgi:hypothetical protein